MAASATALALSTFRRLPLWLRRFIIHVATPSYAVGAVAVVRDADGAVLLLRERHHDGWGLPGGLVGRGEPVADAVRRELREELAVDLPPSAFATPTVVVDPVARRVDVVYLVEDADLDPAAQPPEVLEARWFAVADLPELFAPAADVLRSAGVDVADSLLR